MKTLSKSIFIIIFAISSQLIFASGQRTTVITTDAIKNYKVLSLDKDKLNEKVMHYIGTVNNEAHILMVTKTSRSRSSSGRVGMPWDRVFKYKISVDEITVVNGWDLTDKIKQGGFKVRPSYCPRLVLSPEQNKYVLPNIEKIKLACLKMRRRY